MQKLIPIALLVLMTSVFSSCSEDDTVTTPLSLGNSVEIRNTLQIAADPSLGGTGGNEVPVEVVFDAPTGTYELNSTVSNAIEFDDYLEGLYDIDLSQNSINFSLVAAADHPIYQSFFRTIEAGTFDRYYLSFSDDHNISSFESNNSSVKLNIISEKEIVIVIGEGWNFNPGSSFAITLN